MRRSLCFTVDVDRDVNIPIKGMNKAGSMDRGSGKTPRYDSSAEGLRILTELLDEMGVKATYFAEGRTLMNIGAQALFGREVGIHGLDHEDMTGTFPSGGKEDVLIQSRDIVEDMLGVRPRCSRMPYMKMSDEVPGILSRLGIIYDSSEYKPLARSMMPYDLDGITEIPVPTGTDNKGKKIVGYLWPMHEGKRKPSEYVGMTSTMEEGIFVLATHSWHITESIDGGRMSNETAKSNLDNVRQVIGGILDLGFKAETLPGAAQRFACAH